MIKIKSFILDETNWLEATWVEEVVSINEETQESTTTTETQLHCESYSGHPELITMLRNKAFEFGTELDEDLISECIANFKYPTEEELAQQELEAKIAEARAYLAETDYKDLPRYKPKEGEDIEAIYAKRDELREFIRANNVLNP